MAGVHFHLRSNVRSALTYRDAIDETMAACRRRGIEPEYLDCGGGLPVAHEIPLWESVSDEPFDLVSYASILSEVPNRYPSVREVWLENGRFITSNSAVLVVRVLDVKDRTKARYIICDGGRTNHAIVSEWQRHTIRAIPNRAGPTRPRVRKQITHTSPLLA